MSLHDGLIYAWLFDDTPDDEINGVSGTATDITYATGKTGSKCAVFNGTSAVVNAGSLSNFEGLSDFSISFWFLRSAPYEHGDVLFGYTDETNGIQLRYKFNNLVYTLDIPGKSVYQAFGNPAIDTWAHAVLTITGNVVSIYLNNSLVNTYDWNSYIGTTPFEIPSGMSALFGKNTGSTRFYPGSIDQFFIYNKVISSAERAELYNSGNGFSWPLGSISTGPFVTTGTIILGSVEPQMATSGAFSTSGTITATACNDNISYYYIAHNGSIRKIYESPYVGWEKDDSDFYANYSDSYSGPLAVDKAGNIYGIFYNLTTSNYCISKINPDGAQEWLYEYTHGGIDAIAVDPAGTAVYFASSYNSAKITKLDASDGSEITTGNWPLTDTEIASSACVKLLYGRDGNLYNASNDTWWEDIGHVFKIDPGDGSITWDAQIKYSSVADQSSGYTNYINDIDVNASGTVAIASVRGSYGLDTQIYNSSGTFTAWKDIGPQNEAIAIDDDGYVYCGPYGWENGLVKYNPTSSPWWTAVWTKNVPHPAYLAISPDGETLYYKGGYASDSFIAYNLDGTVKYEINFDGSSYFGICQDSASEIDQAWNVTVTGSSGGTVTENETGVEIDGLLPVAIGDDVAFDFTPDDGYIISDILIDSVSNGAIDLYTFADVQSSHVLYADFVQGVSAGSLSTVGSIIAKVAIGIPVGSFSTTGSLQASCVIAAIVGPFSTTGTLSGTGGMLDLSNTITLFKFILTGTADGTTNLEIPISSFQMRMYATTAAYLNVVVPGIDSAAEITARSNGNLELWMCYVNIDDVSDIIYQERALITLFDSIAVSQGAINQSITLSGNESTAQKNARIDAAKSVTLNNGWFNYISTSGALTTARLSKPHPTLKAGDTAVLESGSITVGLLTWIKSESYQTIQITEAAA